jgi:hypothetical protein
MARVTRSLKRRQYRFSLDPMDPVEGEALRRIDALAEEAKVLLGERTGDQITQEEADRYAFKQILLGLLKDRPVELQAPLHRPAAQAPAPVMPAADLKEDAPPQKVPAPQTQAEVISAIPDASPAAESVKAGYEKSDSAPAGQRSTNWHEELLKNDARPLQNLNGLNGLAWIDDGDGK